MDTFAHKNTTIGIWGFGKVGKAATNFLCHTNKLVVFDERVLTAAEEHTLAQHNILHTQELESFLANTEVILPSPGIDLRPYKKYHHKFITELDLFQQHWHKPIIAVTGSVGKTTITSLLGSILQAAGKRVAVGGNIGTASLSLLKQQDQVDYALLEVSSFQLEHCKLFAPDLALITNFYPNHLDRHGTLQQYLQAKQKICINQRPGQKTLAPFDLWHHFSTKDFRAEIIWIYSTILTQEDFEKINQDSCYFLQHNQAVIRQKKVVKKIWNVATLPPLTFAKNWLAIIAVLNELNIPLPVLDTATKKLALPEHRLEKCATINGVTFYNDSKSTTPASTLAAVEQFPGKRIFLIIGGLSKGINREPFIQKLSGTIEKIFCFGKEREQLTLLCKKYMIPVFHQKTLPEVMQQIFTELSAANIVLFSPSGSSFDLYNNFEERGKHFKNLVIIKNYFVLSR